jgi:hypothetical protein
MLGTTYPKLRDRILYVSSTWSVATGAGHLTYHDQSFLLLFCGAFVADSWSKALGFKHSGRHPSLIKIKFSWNFVQFGVSKDDSVRVTVQFRNSSD